MRLLTVVLFFLSSLFLVASVFLFPSFISLFIDKQFLESQSQKIKHDISVKNNKGLLESLASIQTNLSYIDIQKTSLYDTLLYVLERKPKDIKITKFNYVKGDTDNSSLSLEGYADTRDSLLSFSQKLESEKKFAKIELPISNLAKQSDIVFSLTILGKF